MREFRDGFHPAWWCRGTHAQTVWRRLFGTMPGLHLRRERWETPDDDFLDLDFLDPPSLDAQDTQTPTVLFLHGLEGSSRTQYILGMMDGIRRYGWRGVALNFRSCSGEINRQRRFYHSGETTDLDWVVRKLIQQHPGSPLGAVGFSLGGNVLLKWLGENGEKVPAQLRSAVAVSVPFDLAVAARRIDQGLNRIYGYAFLSTLKQKALIKAERYPGLIDPKRVGRITSFAEFDDYVTAPFHGFKDGLDYWTRSSSKQFLGGIRRPTLLISAGDNPFLPNAYIPRDSIESSEWLTGEFPQTGGHVGFVEGRWPWSASYWFEARAMDFLKHHLDDCPRPASLFIGR
jgi:predicted alpha/beta-fold hydrolase